MSEVQFKKGTMVEKTVHQVKLAGLYVAAVIFIGSLGYMLIEKWNFFDALYMTIISITTTGYQEVHPLSNPGKLFTLFVIVTGVGTIAYAGGRVIQFFVEAYVFRRRRMTKKLNQLRNHYIICGYGRMGKRICQELAKQQAPFVVIENHPAEIENLGATDYLFVEGDATDDEVLRQAGIMFARGLVAVLPTEAENVFTTLSAKVLNSKIFVVSRAVEEKTESKLLKAGANRVVKPYEIGGHRMAQVLLRPGVVDFIDIIARDRKFDLSIEEIVVAEKSTLAGQTLAESPTRRELNIIVVAISRQDGKFTYNPGSQTVIQANDKLIVIGEEKNIQKLRTIAGV
ncbi:MAG TPA: potassium channel protein [Caldithrix sp.]|nr:potassium channel protein [Caldithrix sp.]